MNVAIWLIKHPEKKRNKSLSRFVEILVEARYE